MRVFVDIETRSACDLERHGGRRYAEDPSTSLLCAVALIGEDLYTWGPYDTGDPSHAPEIPAEVVEAAASGFEFVAHNAHGFDAPVWAALGLPPAHWRDSADMARRHALPGSLDKLARYLLGECKDDSGARTLTRFMAPNKRTGKFLDPDPAAMRSILRYCVQDVRLLAKCCEKAGLLEPHVDDAVYEVHRHICERGVRVDVGLAKTLIGADAQVKRIAVVSAGLPLTSLRSDKQFRQAVGKLGISIPDAQASTVRGLLGGPADSLARARLDVCTVTEGKAQGFLDRVEADGRIRGALTYYGAHTGRWSSRGVQLQNIPRPPAGFGPGDVEAVREGGFDAARHVAERIGCTVAEVLSGCLRGIVRLDGCQVDLDQIEARVLAWLAEDEKALEEFRAGKDPYAELASRMGVTRGEAKVVTLAAGYSGSVGALENWAQKFGLSMSRERMAELVEAWRDDRPAVAGRRNGGVFETAERAIPTRTGGLWKRYEKAAKKAIGGFTTVVGPVSFSKLGPDMFAHLPSGRFIRYRNAAVEDVPDKWGDGRSGRSIMYDHPRYGRISTYGGSLCENICQAIARDVMAEALLRIRAPMVLLVHDEVLAEDGMEEIQAALTTVPAWAPGLPLGAEGLEVRRYAK